MKLTKLSAIILLQTMLLSTNVFANSDVTTTYTESSTTYTETIDTSVTPLFTQDMEAYGNMISKATLFTGFQTLVIDQLSRECIKENALNKAIDAANEVASRVEGLNLGLYYAYSWGGGNNTNFSPVNMLSLVPTADYFRSGGNKNNNPLVDFNANSRLLFSQLQDLLKTASVGGIQIRLQTKRTTDYDGRPEEGFNQLFLSISQELVSLKVNHYALSIMKKVDDNEKSSFSDISQIMKDYAKFLGTVKTFYQSAGCYDKAAKKAVNAANKAATATTTTTAANDNEDSDEVSTANTSSSKKNAVITAKNKSITLGSSFDMMKDIKATDNGGKGKDITKNVTVSGSVNTTKAGTYKLTYKVTGANGKTVSKNIKVKVTKQ